MSENICAVNETYKGSLCAALVDFGAPVGVKYVESKNPEVLARNILDSVQKENGYSVRILAEYHNINEHGKSQIFQFLYKVLHSPINGIPIKVDNLDELVTLLC